MTIEVYRALERLKSKILSTSLGEVTCYHEDSHTADVQLFVLQDITQQEGALLRDVPILMGLGGDSFCFSPLKEKELVILGFCSHPVAELQKKNPVFSHITHNTQDALILGTLNILGDPLNLPSGEGLFLGFEKSFIQVEKDKLNIKIGSSVLEVSENKITLGGLIIDMSKGKITLGNIEISQDDVKVGNISLQNHMHQPGTYVGNQGAPITGVSGAPI